MKTTLLTLTLSVSILQAVTDMSWIDQKIDEIKPARAGLNNSTLASIKSPFIVIKEKQTVSVSGVKGTESPSTTTKKPDGDDIKKDLDKSPLTLQIVLNSSALISGKWVKENDLIRGYKLSQIQSDHVVLERKSKQIKLFIAQKNKNLNISTK